MARHGRQVLEEIDRRGILATPANSSINELVVEAARLSIVHGRPPRGDRVRAHAATAELAVGCPMELALG